MLDNPSRGASEMVPGTAIIAQINPATINGRIDSGRRSGLRRVLRTVYAEAKTVSVHQPGELDTSVPRPSSGYYTTLDLMTAPSMRTR